ncbi:MAG: ATP-binding protein [Halieaceae bacterium]|jgi:C4-dicarboxylate-specific signal transduction histidine kinase|nr:ATP-binding protein [Halieaceae bacterium]
MSETDNDYKIAYQREKKARKRAEEIIEERNREMYHLRQDLSEAREQLQSNEETLLQADKLKSMGQLASGITHEINNPLAYITSNVHQLNEFYATLTRFIAQQRLAHEEEVDDEMRKDLAIIMEDTPEIFSEIDEGLARISNIVSNVKRFARKHARHRALSDINQEIRATLKLVEKQLKPETRITLKLENLPLVSCNVSEIGQVVINLVMNADQAYPEPGGEIVISTRTEGRCVIIGVSDKGPGIPEDAIDNIFDPFFTTKPVGEGTGLGLSVSYGIVEDHGGKISVASELGAGTTFTIVLPID